MAPRGLGTIGCPVAMAIAIVAMMSPLCHGAGPWFLGFPVRDAELEVPEGFQPPSAQS